MKMDLEKTRIIIIFLLFLVYSHFYQIYMNNIGMGHYKDDIRLYDICHKYLPNYEKYELFANLYIVFVLLFTLLKPSYIIPILFELVAYMVPILFVRSIFTMVTVLPKSSNATYDPYTAFINGGCYDKIFSGHIAVIFVLTLLLNKYKIITFPIFILLNFMNVLITLLIRSHYTIDIVVSFCITYLMYINKIRL